MTSDAGVASKQKAAAVAGKSKSSEKKENSRDNEEIESSDANSEADADVSESISEDPVVIEGEATEVDATVEDSPEDEEGGDTSGSGGDEAEAIDEPATDDSEPATVSDAQPSSSTADTSEPTGAGASVLALVFGGIVAGAIGYFGSTLAPKPEAPVFDDTELSSGVSANASALAELRSDLAVVQDASAPEIDMSALDARFDPIAQSLDELAARMASLQAELSDTTDALETRIIELDERILALETAVPAAGELATDDELRALRTRIEEMMVDAEARLEEARAQAEEISREAADMRAAAEAEALEAAADAERREAELQAATERQAALINLMAAVEAGSGYSDVLPTLGSVPEVLAANAETGVPTMQSLQEGFPSAARAALAASVTVAEDASTGERLTAFLKRRTNARSLTEQEGDGPDAILSRAEARLSEGDLSAALTELDDLSDTGKAALTEWLGQAQTRHSAVTALNELTATN